MKVLKIVLIVLAVLIGVIIILGFVAPKKYHVERDVIINAPKPLVFQHIKYWDNWHAWSPWAERDTIMTYSIKGTDGEEGSVYSWVGDPKITGTGEMVNTGIIKNEEINYRLHFFEPMEDVSDGYLRLSEVDEGTRVVWAFYGTNPFPWNVVMLFMSLEKMVGPDFEHGLAMLKEICENEAAEAHQGSVQHDK